MRKKMLAFCGLMCFLLGCGSSNTGNLPNFSEDGSFQTKPSADEQIVLAYVWSGAEELPDPTVLTHINYAFGEVNKAFNGIIIQRPEHLSKIADLKAQNADLKICLSIGGFGSDGFSQMARDVDKRRAFANDCRRVIDEYGIDGIDIDWEYPTKNSGGIAATPDDTKNYTFMMHEIRKAIGKDKLLTLASSASAECFDFKDLLPMVDYVNIMSYDMDVPPHHHSALHQSEHTGQFWAGEAVTLHKNAGFPLDKLVLGVPFYGHGDGENVAGFIDYKDIVKLEGFTECWDDAAKVPYLTNRSGKFVCTFENAKSLSYKCRYVKEKGLKGIMYWRYDADEQSGTLRNAVYNAMKAK